MTNKTLKQRTGLAVATLATLGLTLGTPGKGWSENPPALLSYVILAEKGHALTGKTLPIVRVVLEHEQGFSDSSCAQMTMSTGQGTPIQLVTRTNPNVQDMPITVCEALFPFATTHQVQGETWTLTDKGGKTYPLQLPTVSQAPEAALILGDTGCRGNKVQTCDNDWPLPTAMAEQMADQLKKQSKPAVIIHVGDFKYRGKSDPKPNGDTNNTGLKWTNWKADFFTPMFGSGQNLFAMAPWVVTRGNHELCKEMGDNGDGWFFLLDPTSAVAGDTPEQIKANSCQGIADGMTPPYRMDFTNGLSLIVMDTAGLYEGKDVCNADKNQLVAWYKEIEKNFKGSKQNAWIVTHKPTWAVLSSTCGKPSFSNPTPQAALEELDHHGLPENIKLVLVGHKHLYTSMDVNPKEEHRRMLELVTGNGGVVLNPKAYNGCLTYDKTSKIKDFHVDAQGMSRFGFVLAKLEGGKTVDGWKLNNMALEKTTGPNWGKLVKAQVCKYPVKLGNPACEIKEKELFAEQCNSCDKEKTPDKQAKDCQAGGDDS